MRSSGSGFIYCKTFKSEVRSTICFCWVELIGFLLLIFITCPESNKDIEPGGACNLFEKISPLALDADSMLFCGGLLSIRRSSLEMIGSVLLLDRTLMVWCKLLVIVRG